ncbi:MFS transporter [Seonamhaeicola sp. MEBiC1930]|uniref:NTP/NDP exchange transporter n=1 Tax=Seonamhaeicola sp. MEBiC01930 TaxID=2976768 RepID=UPI003248DB0C
MNLKTLFTSLTQIKPSEVRGVLLSFLFVFILMASYMILRPVRDALPSDWGDVSLAVQWSFTFVISTITVSVYNFFASKILLQKLVPGVFVFFALSFFSIFILSKTGFNPGLLGKVFYVWTSVFALFHISTFWSFTSQAYTKEESKRVFGFINTGASVGAITGPLLVILLVKNVPLETVLLITSVSLILVLPIISILNKVRKKSGSKHEATKGNLNPNPFSGFQDLVTNRQLLNISLFIFLFSGISSFLYIAQNEVLVDYSRSERRELLGSLDLAVNTLTILLGIFFTNRITRKFGLSTALSVVPFFIALTLLLLSLNPAVMFVLALQLLRKSGNYAITRPAREILYTGVSKEARFKTKPIIDVAIYRGGDVFWIWALAFLGDGYFNLSLSEKLWIGAAIAIIWGVLGVRLGRRYEQEDKL